MAGERRRVLDEAVPVEHAEARDVDQAVAAAGHDQRAGDRLRPDDRRRALDGEHGHRRRVGSAGRQRQRLLVEQWVVERRAEAGAVAGRRADPLRRRIEELLHLLRAHEVVPVDLEIGAQEDAARAHQPGDRGDRGGVDQALLDPPVERVQQVVRLGRAVRDQLPGDVGAVGQAGCDRVDRVPPAVRREVGARHLEDARVVRAGVDGVDRPGPVVRDRLGALQVLAVVVAVP